MTRAQVVLLALRVTMETGIVAGLAWWGFHMGNGGALAIALAVLAPAIGFGVWGAVDFHQAGRYAEPLRLLEELVISGLAAWALIATGQPVWGWALAVVSIVYHGLVYVAGERLLHTDRGGPQRRPVGGEAT